MTYRNPIKKVAKIRIAGPDQKGIIAAITGFLSKKSCNIEDIDQRILDGYLTMNMQIDYSSLTGSVAHFIQELTKAAKLVGMTAEFKSLEKNQIKNVALLVSKEAHCLQELLSQMKKGKLQGKAVVIIGNHPDLEPIAKQYKVPFYFIPSDQKKKHEAKIFDLLKKYNIDLIVLARYMQILSPEFNFRYEGKIINIHPSLLPAFPGPRSYHQAYNKGVEIVGVTAHFVTTDLDEGPIIAQNAFRIDKTKHQVEEIIKKGKRLEAQVLCKAVKLFLSDRLCLRRGKVLDSKKLHNLSEQTKHFYEE